MLSWLKSLAGFKATPAAKPAQVRVRAAYDNAQYTDENANAWSLTDLLSAKSANNYQIRRTLRIRARYEVANNSYARGITLTLANDLIGTGPRLQVQTGDEGADRQVEQAWSEWAAAIALPEKLHTMKLAKVQDGEAFGLLFSNPKLDTAVKLDIGLIEADQVTTPTPQFDTKWWVDGVVLDERGNVIGYVVLDQHPGDFYFSQLNPMAFKTYPSRYVLHWFRKDRPGQVRGVPEITPALGLFNSLRRFTQATIVAAETAANFAAMLESEAPADGTTADPTPFETLSIERGLMAVMPAGWKMNQLRSEHPTTTYAMFKKEILQEVARCMNVPYNVASGSSEGYNFSSSRLDHILYGRSMRVERSLCQRVVLDRLFHAWLDEAVMVPSLLPRGLNVSHVPHRWFWDAVESVDPVKDATADQIRLETNTVTLEELYAERGVNWEDALRQRKQEADLMKSLGLAPAATTSKKKPPH